MEAENCQQQSLVKRQKETTKKVVVVQVLRSCCHRQGKNAEAGHHRRKNVSPHTMRSRSSKVGFVAQPRSILGLKRVFQMHHTSDSCRVRGQVTCCQIPCSNPSGFQQKMSNPKKATHLHHLCLTPGNLSHNGRCQSSKPLETCKRPGRRIK